MDIEYRVDKDRMAPAPTMTPTPDAINDAEPVDPP